MRPLINLVGVLLVVGAVVLAGGGARAANVYWQNVGGVYSGDYTNTANWAGGVPGSANDAYFTNNQTTAYTVKFTQSVTNQSLRVYDDAVNFDLNGYTTRVDGPGWYYDFILGTNKSAPTAVKIFSTAASRVSGGNTVTEPTITSYGNIGCGAPYNGNPYVGEIAYRATTLTVDDSGGYPVTVSFGPGPNGFALGDANLIVSGSGTVFRVNYGGSLSGNALIRNNALLDTSAMAITIANGALYATTTVDHATMKTAGLDIANASAGWESEGTLILSNNATLTDGGTVKVGFSSGGSYFTRQFSGKMQVDNSTVVGQRMEIGGYGEYWGVGKVQILNGSSMTLSNGLFINATNYVYAPFGLYLTNTLVLRDSTLRLGGGALGGTLTNRGVVQAMGTISGIGTARALVRNENLLDIGGSIGTLTLSNANLQLAAGSKTMFEFNETGLDQIVINGGSANLLGTNLFTITGGAPVPGVKYGLGVYDFVIGNAVTNNPQYDNLVNLLTNTYHLTYGVDFTYGVVQLNGGLFALELMFVPEPSTVMLLALGGLMVWRRRMARRQRVGFQRISAVALTLALLTLAGTGAQGATTNYWQSVGGVYSGNYTNISNWAGGALGAADFVYFTNKQSSAYTVTLSKVVTNGPLKIYDDSVNFNLNGYTLQARDQIWGGVGTVIGTNYNVATTVRFSSTSATNVTGGNAAYLSDLGWQYGGGIGPEAIDVHTPKHPFNRLTTVYVDDSGGYPVTVDVGASFSLGDANLIVSGTGTVFRARDAISLNGTVLIKDGALLQATVNGVFGVGVGAWYSTTTVVNATVKSAGGRVGAGATAGWSSQGTLILSNNSTWTDSGSVQVGNDASTGTGLYPGTVLVDGSRYTGQIMTLGGNFSGTGPGQLLIRSGSTVTLSNRLVISEYNTATLTNKLVLSNGTLNLGGGANGGLLTNRGILQAMGTISGIGTARALVRNENLLDIGGSIGQLTLSNVNLQVATGSKTLFEFNETGLDQIVINSGSANLLGTNQFTITGAAPVPGVKYGLGIYDFVIGATITNSPQYDNLVNLLTNTYHLTYGVDFTYGVVQLNGGLFALELMFVPEPSTVLLLAVGGLLVWRRLAKRGGRQQPVAGRK